MRGVHYADTVQVIHKQSDGDDFFLKELRIQLYTPKCDMLMAYIIFKVGVNPEILENRKCRNFLTLTLMYVKVYISRMEMSQRIHFWHQNLLKIMIF